MRAYHWVVLTPALAVAAACSPRSDSAVGAAVSDSLESDLVAFSQPRSAQAATVPQGTSATPIVVASTPAASEAEACRAMSAGDVKPATIARQAQASVLVRRGIAAELAGNLSAARAALGQAARLDPANTTAVYHLGRIDEQSADAAGAVREYCRFLSLAPTSADAQEVRDRLKELAPATRRVASAASATIVAGTSAMAGIGHGAPSTASADRTRERAGTTSSLAPSLTPREPAPRAVPVREPASSVAAASTQTAAPVSSSEGTRSGVSVSDSVLAAAGQSTAGTTRVESSNGSVAPDASARRPVPAIPPRAPSNAGNTARDVVIGVGAGAILGAVIGRSTRGAIIGAAAGGVLGGVIGKSPRPPRGW